MILAGDAGGTKTILALYSVDQENPVCVKKQTFQSQKYAFFEQFLTEFVADLPVGAIDAVCIGVAGPCVGGECNATNLPWRLKSTAIAELVGTSKVCLLNDLEATAWGLLVLPESDFVELNPNALYKSGHKAVLAAGTGLGEAIIFWDGFNHHVMPSEGGHTDFAPKNNQEIDLLKFLIQKYDGHVSFERVVSGMGLVNIYDFLKTSQFAPEHPEVTEQMLQQDKAAVIGARGVLGDDPLTREALRLFCRLYGAQAGNLALTCLSYGGVMLAGGIAAKLLPVITQGDLMQGFLEKGRYRSVLNTISVKVCTNPEAALLGALSYAGKLYTLGGVL